eukprot:806569_1
MANLQTPDTDPSWKPPKWYHEKARPSSSSFLNEKKLNRGKMVKKKAAVKKLKDRRGQFSQPKPNCSSDKTDDKSFDTIDEQPLETEADT